MKQLYDWSNSQSTYLKINPLIHLSVNNPSVNESANLHANQLVDRYDQETDQLNVN